jgi:hypothetical protein
MLQTWVHTHPLMRNAAVGAFSHGHDSDAADCCHPPISPVAAAATSKALCKELAYLSDT